MSSRKTIRVLFCLSLLVGSFSRASGYEIFLYRPVKDKKPAALTKKISVSGEFFAFHLAPSTFPSYNDLSGKTDKWNFGFQNRIYITDSTLLMAQLLTHDDGTQRTKFDWHFHLRQRLADSFVLFIGHDSDHDSEHLSRVDGKPFFTNRNYIGLGLPMEGENFYVEPFTWVFHHSNLRTHLDFSGEKIKQEFGLRLGALLSDIVGLHAQIVSQSDAFFDLGQIFMGELIVRIELAPWLELSVGGSFWKDIKTSPLGNKKSFSKLMWGLAIPF